MFKEKPISEESTDLDLIPQLSLDCVIFGFHEGMLKCLLLKWKGTQDWSLPGGLIRQTESIDAAATRVLKERTGLGEIFLNQFHTFGKVKRYDKNLLQQKLEHIIDVHLWYERAISIGYYALVNFSEVSPNPDQFTDECVWWELNDLPHLLFDHREIIHKALQSLRKELSYQPVGYNLLPIKFTMPELMRLYEAILDRKIDPRNFQKKILKSGIVDRLDEVKKGVAHKSPYLYSFNKKKYEEVLGEGGLFFT
jgi:8-oxo-dGTP diphosphatase